MENIDRTKERELAGVLNAAEERLLVEFDEERGPIRAEDVEQVRADRFRVLEHTNYPLSGAAKDDVKKYYAAVRAFVVAHA